MKKFLYLFLAALTFSPDLSSACASYSCTVWYYSYGDGTTSCGHVHTNDSVCANSPTEAANIIKTSWESKCDPSFPCGCSTTVTDCHASSLYFLGKVNPLRKR